MSSAEATEGTEQRSSVKLIRNASGATQIEVRVYGDDLAAAQAEAERVYNDLHQKYPAIVKAAR